MFELPRLKITPLSIKNKYIQVIPHMESQSPSCSSSSYSLSLLLDLICSTPSSTSSSVPMVCASIGTDWFLTLPGPRRRACVWLFKEKKTNEGLPDFQGQIEGTIRVLQLGFYVVAATICIAMATTQLRCYGILCSTYGLLHYSTVLQQPLLTTTHIQ